MARRNAQTYGKRLREQAKQQKRQAKDDKKALRKAQKSDDPDADPAHAIELETTLDTGPVTDREADRETGT
jgi:hypothetical protein